MSSLAVFAFENQEIRFVKGKPVANDVAIALGYNNPAKTISTKVDKENKGVTVLATPGGRQKITVLEEAGIYQLIFGSKLPSAKKFKQWVFETVLPEIRKTGGFNLSADQRRVDTRDTLAKKTRKSLTDQIKVYLEDMGLYDDPDAWEHFASAHDRINTLLTTETAKKMRRRIEASTGVKIKESDLIRDWYPQVRLIDYIVGYGASSQIATGRGDDYRPCCAMQIEQRLRSSNFIGLSAYMTRQRYPDTRALEGVPMVWVKGTLKSLAESWKAFKDGKRAMAQLPKFKSKKRGDRVRSLYCPQP